MISDSLRQMLRQDGTTLIPMPDGSRLHVVNEPETVWPSLPGWVVARFERMKVVASERYLGKIQASSSLMDMRHKNPPGVVFHFEGQRELAETGTQILFATGGGVAEDMLTFAVLMHLVPGEEPTRLLRWHQSGTTKSRQRIMKRVNQLIAQHQDAAEKHAL